MLKSSSRCMNNVFNKKGQNHESISLQKITRTENNRVVKASGFSRFTSDFKPNLHYIFWMCAS